MLCDLSRVSEEECIYDVVLVGAGAAGLVLARSLLDSRLTVALLEAGGVKRSKTSQEFYRGEIVDSIAHPEIHTYRVRAAGGSSTIWGGRVVPLDEIDFHERPWVPGSGWPIGLETLAPYYVRAIDEVEAGDFAFDVATALPGAQRGLAPGLDGDYVTTTLERFSRPTNFWKRSRRALAEAANVHVFLESAVTAVRLRPEGRAVDHLEVTAPDGTRKKLRGRTYVLALGGLETTRLLLASNDVKPAGIGNDDDHVGRYYMSHLCTTAGVVTFNGPANRIAYDYETDRLGIYVRRRLWVTEGAQREFGLLNTTFRTHLPEVADPAHGDAILSAMFLRKHMILDEYARRFVENPVTPLARLRHVGNVMRQPLRLARFAAYWIPRRNFATRKLPSVVLGSKHNRYVLEFHAEQSPNPSSRLTLGADRDAFGMPRLEVDWQPTDLDIDSLKGCYRLLARELERTGTGRLDYDPETLGARARRFGVAGGHFIGTTRMSADPRRGVVDPDCRVHGIGNLFIASSSVFPTSGQANPTLTILALALRLSDHLAGRLGRRSVAAVESSGAVGKPEPPRTRLGETIAVPVRGARAARGAATG